MRGGAALGGDEGDDLLRVEQGGVGGGEVLGDQDEGLGQARDPRHRRIREDGDDAVAHIRHVPGPLGHVTAQRLEHVGERAGGLPHGALGDEPALAHLRLGRRGQSRVGGHLGGGLEQGAPLALGLGRGELEPLLDPLRGLRNAVAFLVEVSAGLERGDLGLGDTRRHAGDRTCDEPGAHANAGQGSGCCVGRGHAVLLNSDGGEYHGPLCPGRALDVSFPPSDEYRLT